VLEYDFEQSVGYWVISTAHLYQRVLNEELAPYGITFRQCQTLGYLALEGPLSQSQLAERMGIEPPTLVGILDRMERDGWIRRDCCTQDRRKKLIHPTSEAEPIWSTIVACGHRVRSRATAGLTPAELRLLESLLQIVRDNLAAGATADEASSADEVTEIEEIVPNGT
jgi:MarR family transcriptional regulator for hemolysin